MRTRYDLSHKVLTHPKFQRWKQRVESNGNTLKNIEILATISRDQVNLFLAFIDCQLETPEGHIIPRCILIGGDSIVVVPVLRCHEDGEIYTLMVEQRRIIDGGYSKEFPAGTVDLLGDDPRAMACQEVQEELHFSVNPEELISLSPVKVVSSLMDGLVHYFYFKKEVSWSFLKGFDGLSTGCHTEHEYIKVRLVKMSEVVDCMTSSAIIGVKLVERALNRIF